MKSGLSLPAQMLSQNALLGTVTADDDLQTASGATVVWNCLGMLFLEQWWHVPQNRDAPVVFVGPGFSETRGFMPPMQLWAPVQANTHES